MAEQGYNFLDGPIHSMVDCFQIKIENLEKMILSSVPSWHKTKKRASKKRKATFLDELQDKNSGEETSGKKIASFTARVDIVGMKV